MLPPGTSPNRHQPSLGTNAQGTAPLDMGFIGVRLIGGGSLLVGGLTATPGTGAGNLISGLRLANSLSFAVLLEDPNSNSAGASPVTIQGNLIGTNATGTAALPGPGNGIVAYRDRLRLLIGGPEAGARNVISGTGRGNGDAAILVRTESSAVTVQTNLIGTALDGVTPIPNKGTA